MSVVYALQVIPFSRHSTWSAKTPSDSFSGPSLTAGAKCSLSLSTVANPRLIEKIRERLRNGKAEISPSAYDTAWVAMVPSREYSGERPYFGQCLDWIMENQNRDGSWGLNPGHPSLVKDSLSCTLACVLALRKWNVGHQFVQRGLDFMLSNGWAATRNDQFSPIGFNIIFPAMLNYAKELDLALPLNPAVVDSLLRIRDSEIRETKQDYLAEGLGNSCNWKEIISTHQRSNGSLFNSPATTAAALIHFHDDKCVQYLASVLKACNRWVPTVYPMDIYTRLCVVDTLDRLGISRYFGFEKASILDKIYRSWLQKEEEIFSDVTCLAMTFRLLRASGYNVSSDELTEFVDQEHFFNHVSIQYSGETTVLELYRASQFRICEEEYILEEIRAWTSVFLRQQLLNESILDKQLQKQVEYDLKNFHGTLNRFEARRSIEVYDAQDFQLQKTAYRCPTIHNEDFILFSMQDFRDSQSQFQKELQQMESKKNRWYTECRLDRLNKGREKMQMSYIFTAAAIDDPELSVARMAYAQAVVLISCFDDFFDLYGSKEEALSIVELITNWDTQPKTIFCSEEVETLFTALYNTVNEIADQAYDKQGYCVRHDLFNMWVELLTSFVREKNSWSDHNTVPTLDEYLSSAWKSIGVKLSVFTSIHFLGTKLAKDMFTCSEYTSLCQHASLVIRLLNDLKTFKREADEMVLNSVSVQTVEGGISEDEAILNVQEIVDYNMRKVLQMVYQGKGSFVPRECKELFLKTCKIGHCLYPHDGGDEYTSPKEIAKDINAVIWEPLELSPPSKIKMM